MREAPVCPHCDYPLLVDSGEELPLFFCDACDEGWYSLDEIPTTTDIMTQLGRIVPYVWVPGDWVEPSS